MPNMAPMSRTCQPGHAGPNFTILTPRRAARLPVIVAILAAVLGLLAGRRALTGTARDAAPVAGVIAGRVMDVRGEPLEGATVTFGDASASSAVQTDARGRFASPPLAPGSYSVRADLFGFEPGVPPRISVPSERHAELTMALDLAPLPGR